MHGCTLSRERSSALAAQSAPCAAGESEPRVQAPTAQDWGPGLPAFLGLGGRAIVCNDLWPQGSALPQTVRLAHGASVPGIYSRGAVGAKHRPHAPRVKVTSAVSFPCFRRERPDNPLGPAPSAIALTWQLLGPVSVSRRTRQFPAIPERICARASVCVCCLSRGSSREPALAASASMCFDGETSVAASVST